MTRRYRVNATCALCETCDQYHVVAKTKQYPVKETWRNILNLLAQGYDAQSIGRLTVSTTGSVRHQIEKMQAHFYALNTVNLIAISISLGIVSPNDFVPNVTERNHP